MMSSDLSFTRRLGAGPDQVYFAFTNPVALTEWLCNDARCAARPGGRLYLWWQAGYFAAGEFTDLEPDSRVAFSWQGQGEPAATRVTVTLEPEAGQTRVTLVHHDVGHGPAWQPVREQMEKSWPEALANLKSVLDDGVDQRLARQPMLGIGGGGSLSAAHAAELGLPVAGGFVIGNVIEGLAAADAGLVGSDVVVQIGDDPVTNGGDLVRAVGRHNAGDTVAVAYYRAGDRHETEVTLSGRPAPPDPGTPAELGQAVRQVHEAILGEIDAVLAETSDEQARFKPDESAWNVLEYLAHLILTERWVHETITLSIAGQQGGGFANDHGVHGSIARVYESPAGLREELRRCFDATVMAVERLPAGFCQRKASYRNLAQLLLQLPYHTRSHLDDMRAVRQKARAAFATPA